MEYSPGPGACRKAPGSSPYVYSIFERPKIAISLSIFSIFETNFQHFCDTVDTPHNP
jgi:hypothetical protein